MAKPSFPLLFPAWLRQAPTALPDHGDLPTIADTGGTWRCCFGDRWRGNTNGQIAAVVLLFTCRESSRFLPLFPIRTICQCWPAGRRPRHLFRGMKQFQTWLHGPSRNSSKRRRPPWRCSIPICATWPSAGNSLSITRSPEKPSSRSSAARFSSFARPPTALEKSIAACFPARH